MAIAPHRQRVIEQFPKGSIGCEIGVYTGTFSAALLETVAPKRLWLVDPWSNFDDNEIKGAWYHKDSKVDMNKVYQGVLKTFSSQIDSGVVKVLRGKSVDVMGEIPGESLDFAYVDGDHRFAGVLLDLELAAPRVKNRGVIVLDDHKLGSWWGDGVIRALNTFLGKYPSDWKLKAVHLNQVVIEKIKDG